LASCPTWKYKNVTEKVFQSLRSLGKEQGYVIPNKTSGKFSIKAVGMAVRFEYSWNKTTGTLQLVCVKKPPVGCSFIKNIADGIVQKSGGQVS